MIHFVTIIDFLTATKKKKYIRVKRYALKNKHKKSLAAVRRRGIFYVLYIVINKHQPLWKLVGHPSRHKRYSKNSKYYNKNNYYCVHVSNVLMFIHSQV